MERERFYFKKHVGLNLHKECESNSRNLQTNESIRRQSSAFEFRSVVEPTYENLSRDVSSRASLRRRNSSVKDLILRLEAARQGEVHEFTITEESPGVARTLPLQTQVRLGGIQ